MPAGHAFSYWAGLLPSSAASKFTRTDILCTKMGLFIPNPVAAMSLMKEWICLEILQRQKNIYSSWETNLRVMFQSFRLFPNESFVRFFCVVRFHHPLDILEELPWIQSSMFVSLLYWEAQHGHGNPGAPPHSSKNPLPSLLGMLCLKWMHQFLKGFCVILMNVEFITSSCLLSSCTSTTKSTVFFKRKIVVKCLCCQETAPRSENLF